MRLWIVVLSVMVMAPAAVMAQVNPQPKKVKPFSLACPSRLAIKPPVAESLPPAGFELNPKVPTSHGLKRVRVFSQHRVFEPLQPYRTEREGAEWMLTQNGRVLYVMVCEYAQTPARLYYALPDGVGRCKSSRKVIQSSKDPKAPSTPEIRLDCT